MAAINDLISQIQDETLRNRIQEEVSKMAKQKKFGLVFEEHMPESTPLYDMPIKRGCNVMRRDSKDDKSIYVVLKIEGDTVVCVKSEQKDEAVTFELKDIVRVAEFGESIYPYLKPLDSVCNAPDSDLWHTLIEADNYHALQLLEYLYAGKVDCIYIDPPYNTGAKDWKYNNDYVDGADAYRHSKWLSFMQRRLRLAKKLLNPKDSVLIVTIDEKEYLHLGCLLEEMFPEAIMQMISSVISFKGSARKQQFTRLDEYIFILVFGEATIQRLPLSDEWRMNPDDERATHLTWKYLIRSGSAGFRERSPGNFYPVFFTTEGKYHSDIVQIDSRADVIIFSSSVVTAKMDLMQRFFGFEQYIRAGAQKTIEIIRDLDIVDSLEKFVAFENKSKLTNAKKLLKAKNSPVLQMKKNDLLENLKKHSRYKTMFKFEEDHIVISSQKEAAAFIKMLNDDIVRSELTGKEYDSSSKMLLGPVGASH